MGSMKQDGTHSHPLMNLFLMASRNQTGDFWNPPPANPAPAPASTLAPDAPAPAPAATPLAEKPPEQKAAPIEDEEDRLRQRPLTVRNNTIIGSEETLG